VSWQPLSLTRRLLDRVLRPGQAARNAGAAADEATTAVRRREQVDNEVSEVADATDRTPPA
jgi:hypothetical protein